MLSSFVLKIIAAVSMLIDHAGLTLHAAKLMDASALYFVLRSVGRIAFPLYAFFLVNGFEKTHDRVKYLTRLCILAIISQIPFIFATFSRNYSTPLDMSIFRFPKNLFLYIVLALVVVAYFLEGRKRKMLPLFLSAMAAIAMYGLVWVCHGYCLLLSTDGDLNIFYTLGCSLAAIWVLDLLKRKSWKEYSPLSLITAAVVCIAVCVLLIEKIDYGWRGMLLVGMLYLFSGNPKMQALMTAMWGVIAYAGLNVSTAILVSFLVGTFLAAVGIFFYSGEQGRRSRAFYYIYPVHLAVFGLICRFISA